MDISLFKRLKMCTLGQSYLSRDCDEGHQGQIGGGDHVQEGEEEALLHGQVVLFAGK